MSIVLEHFQCECGSDKFHVVLEKGKPFKKALIEAMICSKCGLISKNEKAKRPARGGA